MNTKINSKVIARAGIMTAISVILMMVFEFPLPFMPPFLKVDLSNIPIMILAFSLGSVGTLAGFLSILIKDVLHLLVSHTGGVGELADFICSVALVIPASLFYNRYRTKKGAIGALSIGIICATIMSIVANKFILVPFYSLDAIFGLCADMGYINSELAYLLYGVLPFNIIKGTILSIIILLIYKHISKILHK